MWSSAIFLVACLSVAFANPIALLNVRTAQDASGFFVASAGDIPMTGFSTPGQSNSVDADPAVPVLTAAVGNNLWGDKVTSSDFDGIYSVPEASSMADSNPIFSLGSKFNNEYPAQLPNNFFAQNQDQELTLASYPNSGDSTQFSDNLLAQSTQCPELNVVPVRPSVDWTVSSEFHVYHDSNYHLDYSLHGDCGAVTFMCTVDDLACCDSYGKLEGLMAASGTVFVKAKCRKCLFLTNRFLIGR